LGDFFQTHLVTLFGFHSDECLIQALQKRRSALSHAGSDWSTSYRSCVTTLNEKPEADSRQKDPDRQPEVDRTVPRTEPLTSGVDPVAAADGPSSADGRTEIKEMDEEADDRASTGKSCDGADFKVTFEVMEPEHSEVIETGNRDNNVSNSDDNDNSGKDDNHKDDYNGDRDNDVGNSDGNDNSNKNVSAAISVELTPQTELIKSSFVNMIIIPIKKH
jgi:hypothetical protein